MFFFVILCVIILKFDNYFDVCFFEYFFYVFGNIWGGYFFGVRFINIFGYNFIIN